MADLITDGKTLLGPDGLSLPCSMGRNGLIDAEEKREGDGKTPIGLWRLTRLFFRPDRVVLPKTDLPVSALSPMDGWCDDPTDTAYNQAVRLPYPASCETLWREDGLYDLLIVTSHNGARPRPGMGSAIFLHCRDPKGAPTAGCIAVERAALIALVATLGSGSNLVIQTAL